jgi:hypothetical protein
VVCRYKVAPNFHGITLGRAASWYAGLFSLITLRFKTNCTPLIHELALTFARNRGKTAGFMGAATGIFVFFMFAEIPRVSEDIAQKIPILGPWFKNEVAPEDKWF